MDMDGVILIRNIQVQGANAIAGLTWGFPAITHFLGFTHALQRKLKQDYALPLLGCGVVCHAHQVHAHQPSPMSDYLFSLSRNPLDKSGNSAAFVEEGKLNMSISLLIPYLDEEGLDKSEKTQLTQRIAQHLGGQHLAGGMITNTPMVQLCSYDYLENNCRQMLRSLLPGFTLISRHQYLVQEHDRLNEQAVTEAALNAWLHFSALTYKATKINEKSDAAQWQQEQRYPGWLKPIMVGYRPLSPVYDPGQVAKARDSSTPLCFVENLYSVGEWISPHRLDNIEQLIWQQHVSPAGEYLCINAITES